MSLRPLAVLILLAAGCTCCAEKDAAPPAAKAAAPQAAPAKDDGAKSLFDGKMTASLTYFRTDFTNLIDFDSATSAYNNIGRVKTAGVEAAVRIFLLKELELRLSYTFTDAEDKATGDQLIRRPRHKGGVRALYSPVETVRLNAAVMYVGNRSDLDFSTFPGTPVTLDDYILVDPPPSLGLLTINALAAATGVIIPVAIDFYALMGLGQLQKTIGMVGHRIWSAYEGGVAPR